MLVLSRNKGESITIDDVIKVIYVEPRNSGTSVRIGIEAPRHISIVRSELIDNRPILSPEEECRRLETTPLEEMTRSDLCRRIGMLEQEKEILRSGFTK